MIIPQLPSPIRDRLERLGRPEYTGENRCLPCTAVNAAIATVGAAVVWLAVGPWAGGLALGVAAAVIYLRGYLVPGTPRLTQRYLPDRVRRAFGKAPASQAGVGSLPALLPKPLCAADVVENDGGQLRLERGAREAIRVLLDDEPDDVPDVATVARLLGVDEGSVSRIPGDAAFATDDRLHQWESPAALRADVAGAGLLADRDSNWSERPTSERLTALAGVRALIERCPNCGGPLDRTTESVETCCREPSAVRLSTCMECDVRVLERQQATSHGFGDPEALAAEQ